MVTYPVLVGEIAKRGIKKKTIAKSIGVCDKSLNNKLNGRAPFTRPEVKTIQRQFFPDMAPDVLFESSISFFDQNGTKQKNIFKK